MILSEDYWCDCKDYDVETFNEAIKSVRRESKFWPKVSVVLEACVVASGKIYEKSRMKSLMIEESMSYRSDFDIRKNLLRLKIMGMVAAKDVTMEFGEPLILEITSIKTEEDLDIFISESNFMIDLNQKVVRQMAMPKI